ISDCVERWAGSGAISFSFTRSSAWRPAADMAAWLDEVRLDCGVQRLKPIKLCDLGTRLKGLRKSCNPRPTGLKHGLTLHALRDAEAPLFHRSCTHFRGYCSFAYSALASFRTGRSASASFQRARKSW